MKDTQKIGISILMLLMTVVGASAFTITLPATPPTLTPPTSAVSINTFTTTYVQPNAGAGYEYAFDGDITTFDASILVDTTFNPASAVVQAFVNCGSKNYTVPLNWTGGGAVYNGVGWTAPYHGSWVAPSAAEVSGNCPITVRASLNGGVGTSDLSAYATGNDVLVNPVITLSADSIWYNITHRGTQNLNYANPSEQNVTLTSTVDREGQGVKGQFKKVIGSLCTASSYCLGPQYQYLGVGSAQLAPVAGDGTAFDVPVEVSPSVKLNLHWALLFPIDAPSEAYTGSGDYYVLTV